MFCHQNPVTIENLNLAKIIVRSPQLGDIGNLTKENKLNNREVKGRLEIGFGNQAKGSAN